MPLNLASPGILVREVDLTVGRVDPTSAGIGAIVAPFAQGPVGEPTLIENDKDLLDTFGKPYSNDKHYENWMVASSYLSYGGALEVVRADDSGLVNSFSGDVGVSSVKIRSVEHYEALGYDESPLVNVTVSARNPGTWGDGLRVGIIDSKADQILTIGTSGLGVGVGVTQAISAILPEAGTTTQLDGFLKGIITEVDGTDISVKVLEHVSAANVVTEVDYQPSGVYQFSTGNINLVNSGAGTTSATISRAFGGTTAATQSAGNVINSFLKGSSGTLDEGGGVSLTAGATAIGISTVGLIASEVVGANKFIGIGNEILDATGASIGNGQITGLTRGQQGTSATPHADGSTVTFFTKNAGVGTVTSEISTSGTLVGITTTADLTSKINSGSILQFPAGELVTVSVFSNGTTSQENATKVIDWFDQQELHITNTAKVKWNSVAERPGTSQYAASRGSRFDEVHVVVIDGDGAITANSGTILEKNLSLSKAKDAEFSLGSPSHYRKNIKESSNFIFALSSPAGIVTTGFQKGTFTLESDVDWDQNAEGITFAGCGNTTLVLSGGKNYGGKSTITETGALDSGLDDIVSGYNLFSNTEKTEVDFILMGSAARPLEQSQALANKCIAVAEARKDAVAFISPFRGAAINETTGLSDQSKLTIKSDDDITDNIIKFFAPITSSSYAVFDSGYKYMFDRFNNTFRYVPLNGDIAGTCVRTDSTNFPWFSPAGTSRGAILNAVKLAYNPGQIQRDALYTNRVNPVIFSPGAGIILFGDKTGFGKSSAFDRINVRRLFIFLEDAISAAAKDQLFEFNDEITRTNFVNIVEPFLRDVQAKRGIFDFVVICDETNNTAAVIDNNEFVADIFIKPARSINFIGLTFVATRTGVSFEEVIGNV